MITRQFEGVIVKSDGYPVMHPVQCTLTYDHESDPFAVSMNFQIADHGVDTTWVVDRELLDAGRKSVEMYGTGDLKMKWNPGGNSLGLCLRNPAGHADIALPWSEVSQFMLDSLTEVPFGDEDTGTAIDDAITKILDQG